MGLDAEMAIAGIVAPMYGVPVAGNTGPNSTDGEQHDFPPGKEFGVQE